MEARSWGPILEAQLTTARLAPPPVCPNCGTSALAASHLEGTLRVILRGQECLNVLYHQVGPARGVQAGWLGKGVYDEVWLQ